MDVWRQSEREARDGAHAAVAANGPQVGALAASSGDGSDRDDVKPAATAE